MTLSSNQLNAKGGEIYCHIFENQTCKVAKGLYWSITVNFEPIMIGRNLCECSVISEWIRWPIRSWQELDGCGVNFHYGENGYGSSFYFFEHHPIDLTKLLFKRTRLNEFNISLIGEISIKRDLGIEVDNPLLIQANTTIPFTGLIIDPNNLGMKSTYRDSLEQVARQFINIDSFNAPEPYYNGFRFTPSY
jgi:hypothetical protein